jgi:hypothetical protein
MVKYLKLKIIIDFMIGRMWHVNCMDKVSAAGQGRVADQPQSGHLTAKQELAQCSGKPLLLTISALVSK